MTTEEKLETKDKIIKVASDLFSRFGYVGTSIREIASQSGVNVASVNYHFGSKGNLYWATFEKSHEWLDGGIREISQSTDDVCELIVRAYRFLMEDTAAIRTAMKMMLTDGVPDPEGQVAKLMEDQMGPPGAEYVMKALRKAVPESVSDEALHWGVKSLFGGLIHWATMSSSCKVEVMKKHMPELEGDGIESILRHHCIAIVEYLKTNPVIHMPKSK